MALRFLDGFDAILAGEMPQRWGGSGSYTVSIQPGRLAGNAFRASLYHSGISGYVRTIDAQPTWIVGCAVRLLNAPVTNVSLLDLRDNGTVQVSLGWGGDGKFRVLRGEWNGTVLATGPGVGPAPPTNTWIYVEWKTTIHPSAGTTEVVVNGQSVFAATGLNTRATANSTANQVAIGRGDNSSIAVDYDDLYVCDGAGPANNDFLGDLRVQTLRPTAAGASSGLVLPGGTTYTDYRSAVLADAPVHFWELQEASGLSAADTGAGTASTATFQGVTPRVAGPYAGGYGADVQSGAAIIAPYVADMNLTGDMTAECWIYVPANAGSNWPVVNRGASSAWTFGLGMDTTNQNPRWWQAGNGFSLSGALIGFGRWVHLAGVRVGTAVTLYVDGVAAGTASVAGYTAASSAHPIVIGQQSNGAAGQGSMWPGRVAYVALYGTALTAARVQAHVAHAPWRALADFSQDGDASYAQGANVGDKSTYAVDDTLAATTAVKGVQLVALVRKDEVGSRSAAPVVRSGGTDYTGTATALGTGYAALVQVYETDPATGVAWTKAGADGAEFGAGVTA